ncbi:MFS transporter [Nocardia sp. CDC153]|uniref:MFS transporter n=1 Tax=Nocardia sp. CDC153 TaxID=3112167 RepID=UPI002DB60E31|nr:MFS transporter [Nocardia sp. CDC153]MEC3953439.1 MFS transporter [Nocardia sp. CDC153]
MISTLRRSTRQRRADGFDRRLLVPMITSSILNPINSSIIAVSLVPIGVAFGAPASETAWLVSALYLATAIGQPVVGRLIDLYGPRPLYLTGAALTGLAGVLGMVAPALWVLVLARVILGFGTCAGYPASMYLIRTESERTGQDSPAGVLAALAVANQTIAVIGPSLGGLLIHLGGWRATFAINLPLAVVCLLIGWRRIAKTPAPQPGRIGVLDLPGIALFTAMLITALLFLMKPQAAHWYLPALAVAAGVVLVWRESRVEQPFLDVRLLGGNLPLLATYTRNLLTCIVGYCFLYGFTQWLEEGRRLSAAGAGLILLPMSLTAIAVSAITGRSRAIRGKLLVGSVFQVAMTVLLLTLHSGVALWLLVVAAVLNGIPQGLNTLANQNALYHQAEPERIGSSAGLLRTFSYFGAIGAAAASGAFLSPGSGIGGLHHLAVFMLVAACLCLLLAVVDRSL